MSVSRNIRALRVKAGLSQEALAAKCGRIGQFVTYLEQDGTNPTVSTLEIVAKGLGVEVSALFAEEAEVLEVS
jgi:transcriptional regulator with XRE-family HTH domain